MKINEIIIPCKGQEDVYIREQSYLRLAEGPPMHYSDESVLALYEIRTLYIGPGDTCLCVPSYDGHRKYSFVVLRTIFDRAIYLSISHISRGTSRQTKR